MNRIKRIKVSEQNAEEIAKEKLIKEASLEYSLKDDDILIEKWQNTINEIKEFYAEEYVHVINKHASLITDLNKLSIALLQRQIFTVEELKQAKHALSKNLEKIMENYAR